MVDAPLPCGGAVLLRSRLSLHDIGCGFGAEVKNEVQLLLHPSCVLQGMVSVVGGLHGAGGGREQGLQERLRTFCRRRRITIDWFACSGHGIHLSGA